MDMRLTDGDGCSLRLSYQETELLRYVYRPDDPQVESPRPYFHPVRTLRGDLVTTYRPEDHVWHKGFAWSLPHVGPENFWGGPTFQRGHGYRQLPNNGRIRHEEFTAAAVTDGVLGVDEQLSWITQDGETWLHERRQIGARVLPGAGAWLLAFRHHAAQRARRHHPVRQPDHGGPGQRGVRRAVLARAAVVQPRPGDHAGRQRRG